MLALFAFLALRALFALFAFLALRALLALFAFLALRALSALAGGALLAGFARLPLFALRALCARLAPFADQAFQPFLLCAGKPVLYGDVVSGQPAASRQRHAQRRGDAEHGQHLSKVLHLFFPLL